MKNAFLSSLLLAAVLCVSGVGEAQTTAASAPASDVFSAEDVQAINHELELAANTFPVYTDEMLGADRPERRRELHCFDRLATVGKEGKIFLPALEKVIRQRSSYAASAIEVVGQIGPEAGNLMPLLLELLRGTDNDATAVARAIGRASSDEQVVSALAEAALRPNAKDLNSAAIHALGEMGPPAHKAALAITLAMMNESGELHLRRIALRALGRIGPQAKIAVPLLRQMVKRKDFEYCAALAALCRMGYAKQHLAELLEAATPSKQGPGHGGDAAVAALGNLANEPAVLDALVKLVEDKDSQMSRSAAPALPQLLKALDDNDAEVAGAAIHAIGRLLPAGNKEGPVAKCSRPFCCLATDPALGSHACGARPPNANHRVWSLDLSCGPVQFREKKHFFLDKSFSPDL